MSPSGNTDISLETSPEAVKDTAGQTDSVEEGQETVARLQGSEGKHGDTSVLRGINRTEDGPADSGPDSYHGAAVDSVGDGQEEKVADRNTEVHITQVEGPRLPERAQKLSLYSQSTESSASAHGMSGLVQEKERSPTPPPPPPKDAAYLDPTPQTPRPSAPSSRTPSDSGLSARDPEKSEIFHDDQPKAASGASSDVEFDEKHPVTHGKDVDTDSRSEIQSIMDQFDEGGGGPGMEEVMSPRLELAGPVLGNPIQHPPRKSSLEPVKTDTINTLQDSSNVPHLQSSSFEAAAPVQQGARPSVPPKLSPIPRLSFSHPSDVISPPNDTPVSPNPPVSLHKPPPPEPDPEPELPFDFHRFLEQLRHRTADPVAKFLRSFLLEFGKKQWMVHEQVKIISDFLAFITNKMAQCEVWRGVSDAEFDNAREGMEKLVMNRLYAQTFSPAIPLPAPLPAAKGKRKNMEKLVGPGRRGQHQEDIERDEILAQKVRIYGWVREEHLDIEPVGDSGRRFLVLAQQGL